MVSCSSVLELSVSRPIAEPSLSDAPWGYRRFRHYTARFMFSSAAFPESRLSIHNGNIRWHLNIYLYLQVYAQLPLTIIQLYNWPSRSSFVYTSASARNNFIQCAWWPALQDAIYIVYVALFSYIWCFWAMEYWPPIFILCNYLR